MAMRRGEALQILVGLSLAPLCHLAVVGVCVAFGVLTGAPTADLGFALFMVPLGLLLSVVGGPLLVGWLAALMVASGARWAAVAMGLAEIPSWVSAVALVAWVMDTMAH